MNVEYQFGYERDLWRRSWRRSWDLNAMSPLRRAMIVRGIATGFVAVLGAMAAMVWISL